MNRLAFSAATSVAVLAPISSHADAPHVEAPLGRVRVEAPLLASPILDFSWSGGDPVSLMSTNEGFCWLTSIGGNFRGFGESVALETWGSLWFFTGQNNWQPSVHATASCVRYSAFQNLVNTPFTAGSTRQVNPDDTGFFPVARLENNHSSCFLTKASGAFNGWGEEAEVYFDGAFYELTVQSRAHGWNGVIGGSHCVDLGQKNPVFTSPANATLEYEWHQGDAPVAMIPADQGVCYLTRMTGNFGGPEEEIDARVLGHSATSAGQWYLYGSSVTNDVAASARCTYFLQF